MLLEILILFEIIGFVFLALGLIPFGTKDGVSPLINKVLFLFVSTIVFFMLAMTSVSYDYTYCYIDSSGFDSATNSSTHSATCDNLKIENMGLSALNYGLGAVSIILLITVILVGALTRHDDIFDDADGSGADSNL